MTTRFDLEEAILQAWQTEQDLALLLEHHLDCADPAMSEDDIANAILGIKEIHAMRMCKLWAVFTKSIKKEGFFNED
jgi:hypothetical protein